MKNLENKENSDVDGNVPEIGTIMAPINEENTDNLGNERYFCEYGVDSRERGATDLGMVVAATYETAQEDIGPKAFHTNISALEYVGPLESRHFNKIDAQKKAGPSEIFESPTREDTD